MINIEDFLNKLAVEVENYKVPVVDLIAVQTSDPYKVLVATILSARTKDETTAKASARLFEHAPDITALATLSEDDLQEIIYPVGFYKNKARYLSKLPESLSVFNNRVPDTIKDLLTLPGVGRKTANLVLAVAFKKPAICVDTHVHRIMNLWGYVETKNPEATEKALRKKLPKEYWLTVNSVLVAFGQGKCRPIAPHCDDCLLLADCPKINVTPRRIKTKSNKSANDIRLISWNVNGLRAAEKKGFIDILKKLDADVFSIQETKAMPEQLSREIKNISGYHCHFASAKRKGYSGVAIYSKKKPLNVIIGMGEDIFDDEGRVITFEFDNFFIINAYYPNAQPGLKRIDYKTKFNRAIADFADGLAQKKTALICGDLNVAHKAIDLANPKQNEKNPGYSIEERNDMDSFVNRGWVDTFRVFNQKPGNYSWWSYRFNSRAKNIGWRIDYFMIDKNSKDRLLDAEIMADITGSDHCPVSLLMKACR